MKNITTTIVCALGTLLAIQSSTQSARSAAAAGGSAGVATGGTEVQGTASGTGVRNSGAAVQSGTTVAPFSTVNPNVQVQTGQAVNDPNNPNQRPPNAPAGTFATNQNQFASTNQAGTNQFASTNQFATNQIATTATNSTGNNQFAGTNSSFASSDRGFTEFDQTLITHIRRVIFNPNAQLSISPAGVSFVSQGGVVTMNGVVASPSDVQILASQVQTVPGVVSVTSRLVIDPSVAARIAARNQQHNQSLLSPTSDPSLGDSRRFESPNNQSTVSTGSSGTAVSNQVPTSFTTESNQVITTTTNSP